MCFFIRISVQLAQLVVNAGGVAAVVDYIGDSKGNVRLPGVMMLGYVGAHSEALAMSVITSKVQKLAVHSCSVNPFTRDSASSKTDKLSKIIITNWVKLKTMNGHTLGFCP